MNKWMSCSEWQINWTLPSFSSPERSPKPEQAIDSPDVYCTPPVGSSPRAPALLYSVADWSPLAWDKNKDLNPQCQDLDTRREKRVRRKRSNGIASARAREGRAGDKCGKGRRLPIASSVLERRQVIWVSIELTAGLSKLNCEPERGRARGGMSKRLVEIDERRMYYIVDEGTEDKSRERRWRRYTWAAKVTGLRHFSRPRAASWDHLTHFSRIPVPVLQYFT
ncbi:hypothetical protein KQX54_020145 [Cotesia glomerata]|uniref:Uncharacterized protein n=1 Tax=Cotesia glomerata TaxID=32391 RepID=A0AAV7IFU9_COTGL|nr:hypothetical protein KQX54_020145 [Cotesia glomerata]